MGFESGELTAVWEIEAAQKREEDRQDFARELAGIDVGREARFHSAAFVEERREGRSGGQSADSRNRSEFASRLQTLLATNPAYAQLYNDTLGDLGAAEAATDRAIAKAEAALKIAQEKLEQTLSRAATLPDGTRVFKDKWGQVWTEHGQPLSEADSQDIAWRSGLPGYEAYVEDRDAVTHSVTRLEVLQGYRIDTLGRIRDRMTDQDNPPASDEMEQFKRDIQEQAPAEVRAEMSKAHVAVPVSPAGANLDVPTL